MLKTRLLTSVALFAPPDAGGGADPADPADPPAEGGTADPADPPAEGGTADPADPPAEGGAAPAPAAGESWEKKELRRKHAQIQESRRREAELRGELETLRGINERLRAGGGAEPPADGGGAPPPAQAAPPPAPLGPDNEAVQAAAQRLRDQENFEQSSNKAFQTGVERFGQDKFKAAIDNIEMMGGFSPDDLNAILATDDPAKVLHDLGTKPDEYRRVMDLPPARRFAEMVKLGIPAAAPKPKKVSDAPPPADTVRTQQRADGLELRDDLSDEEWNERRMKQRANKLQRAGA